MRMRTTCNRDCPDACGLIATVEHGKLESVGGDPDHPVTRGFICRRTRAFPARQHSPLRLRAPLMRRAGELREAGWDEALDFIASRLVAIRAESGPAAILHYRSGGSLGMLKRTVDRFFARFGPATIKRGSACSGAGSAGQTADFGDVEAHDVFDVLHARGILLWGKNPLVSSIHVVPLLQQARREGARLVLIDPVHHASARLADRVIAPRPGGDFELALGVSALLVARGHVDPSLSSYCDNLEDHLVLVTSQSPVQWARDAGVSLGDLEALADMVVRRPCATLLGWGMARRSNGAAIVRAIDALCALSGNLGIEGGGASYCTSKRGAFDLSLFDANPPRTLAEARLGHEILAASSPPIRAVWVTAGNPVAMLPDSATTARALATRELVVVVDTFLTDTARHATVVLPTTTLFEDEDLLASYGHHWLGVSRPVLRAPDGVRSDLEIVQQLAARVDRLVGTEGSDSLTAHMEGSVEQWLRRVAAPLAPEGLTVEKLVLGGVRNPRAPKVAFSTRVFQTPSGRMQLVAHRPAPAEQESGYPLWLFSNSTADAQCSQWAGQPPETMPARCHPDAADGMGNGQKVWLESAQGRIPAVLVHDHRQRSDVVVVPKGGPVEGGRCANLLIAARSTDAGEGAAYLDCRVRIVRRG